MCHYTWLLTMCSWSLHLSFGRSGFLRPQGMYPTARLDSFRTQAADTSFSCLQFRCSCLEHLILFRRSFFFDHNRHLDVIWTEEFSVVNPTAFTRTLICQRFEWVSFLHLSKWNKHQRLPHHMALHSTEEYSSFVPEYTTSFVLFTDIK
jgi:hypothetical protein